MGGTLLAIYVLTAFMLIAAMIAVETEDLLSSVLCIGAVGFGLALTDLVLRAPDLALAQVVVELFAVVLLIRTVVVREDTTQETVGETPHVAFIGGVILALVLGMFVCFRGPDFIPFSDPLMKMGQAYLDAGQSLTGIDNQVMAVLLDFRAYDTLGEATVIFTAIMGCYALLRHRGRKDDAGDDTDS